MIDYRIDRKLLKRSAFNLTNDWPFIDLVSGSGCEECPFNIPIQVDAGGEPGSEYSIPWWEDYCLINGTCLSDGLLDDFEQLEEIRDWYWVQAPTSNIITPARLELLICPGKLIIPHIEKEE